MSEFAVILPAAGSSLRFGADKLAAELGGKSVLDRTIEEFASRADVRMVVVAGRANVTGPKILCTSGGAFRAQTVRIGLEAVPDSIEWIAIHDAARPLVSQQLIDRVLAEALRCGAAAPALPIELTVKQARGPLPATVDRTIPRWELWSMQTPQIMRRADLLAAYEHCPLPLDQVTDDAQLLELSGKPMRLVQGEECNIKITRAVDLRLAELLLR